MTAPPPDEIMQRLRPYIEGNLLGGRAIADDEDLLLSGLLDSLAVMSLVAFIEKSFDLKIPFEDVLIENFESLSAIAAYLQGRVASV